MEAWRTNDRLRNHLNLNSKLRPRSELGKKGSEILQIDFLKVTFIYQFKTTIYESSKKTNDTDAISIGI